MTDYVIELEGINKSFSGVKVLDDIYFSLEKGIVHALVGGNGAGKSTLMKILTGVYTSDSGTIKVNGKETRINNPNDAQNNGIKMIFQELSLSPTQTITENIFLNHELRKGIGLNKREMKRRAKLLLEDLGIEADVDSKIQDLDVGVCQLVEIAKALSANSSILVMDEPTSSLTDRETDILFKIIERLKAKSVSIVYISHRMNEIFKIADKIAILKDGKIVADKPKQELNMKSLIDYMIGTNIEETMEYKTRVVPVSDENIMEVKNLSLEGKVHGLSFNLKRGEVLGVAGLMGSGRTEVLETIFGINRQGSAEIIFEGKSLKIKNAQNAIDKGIVLIPEDRRRRGLITTHSLKENILLPNLKRLSNGIKINWRKVKVMAQQSIAELDIKTEGINTIIAMLSGGNQQKVVIAKWLKTQPKVLLMDEPTAGIDVGAKGEIIDIIRSFIAANKSVILVSSEISELMAVCDRILVFKKGTITKEIIRKDIENEEMLQYEIQH